MKTFCLSRRNDLNYTKCTKCQSKVTYIASKKAQHTKRLAHNNAISQTFDLFDHFF